MWINLFRFFLDTDLHGFTATDKNRRDLVMGTSSDRRFFMKYFLFVLKLQNLVSFIIFV